MRPTDDAVSENQSQQTLIHVQQQGLSTYEIAKQALALAVTVDEVKEIHDQAERLKLYAKQANDRELIADAMALVMRSRRRLGEMLIAAKEAGQLSRGGRPSNKSSSGSGPGQPQDETSSRREQVLQQVTLKQAGIDRKLSMEAQKLAGFEEDDFEQVIEKGREKIKAGGAVVINPVKDLNTKEKQLHRDIREAQLAMQQKALPQKRFGIAYADPEWPFDVWSEAGKDRSAENHYPTSALEIIGARPVETIAADDCVLFLWVTAPHHAAGNGAMIMRAWGFEPKAEIIWDKVEVGTGYWFRNQHEILLVGTRGKVPAPAMGDQWPSIVRSPRGAHSEKPDWAYELIEAYFPNLPKIELNARRRREGWDAWGFEAPEDEATGDGLEDLETLSGEESVFQQRFDGVRQAHAPIDNLNSASTTPRSIPRPTEGLAASGEVEPGLAASHSQSPAEDAGDSFVAVAPETHAGAASGVVGGGESADVDPAALPNPTSLSSAQKNDVIRQAYATDPFPGVRWIMAATGLGRSAVKQRAHVMELGDPVRQVTAATAVIDKVNEGRRAAADQL